MGHLWLLMGLAKGKVNFLSSPWQRVGLQLGAKVPMEVSFLPSRGPWEIGVLSPLMLPFQRDGSVMKNLLDYKMNKRPLKRFIHQIGREFISFLKKILCGKGGQGLESGRSLSKSLIKLRWTWRPSSSSACWKVVCKPYCGHMLYNSIIRW